MDFHDPGNQERVDQLKFGRSAGPACRRQVQNPVLALKSLPLLNVLCLCHLKHHKKVYLLGLTSNIEKRFQAHNRGYEKTTKPYKPFILLYYEECENRLAARKREVFLKSGRGKDFLRKLLEKKS